MSRDPRPYTGATARRRRPVRPASRPRNGQLPDSSALGPADPGTPEHRRPDPADPLPRQPGDSGNNEPPSWMVIVPAFAVYTILLTIILWLWPW